MTTLTDKYVYAATRGLPEEIRDDVADELRAGIADRTEALLAEDPHRSPDQAEYAAVAELDDPARMAANYAGKPLHLIGPEAFPAYLCMLRKVLIVVLPLVAATTAVVSIAIDRSFGGIVGATAWTTFNVAVHLCFWITLVWVLVERGSAPGQVQANLATEWTPEDLADPPRGGDFPIGELVASLAFLGATAAFLVGQQFWSWVTAADGDPIPVLNPALWTWWLPCLLVVLAVEAGFEVAKHRAGRWSARLAAINTVINLAFAAPVCYLAAQHRLLNPDFVAEINRSWEAFEPHHVDRIVIATVLVIAVWSVVDGWRRSRPVTASEDRPGSE